MSAADFDLGGGGPKYFFSGPKCPPSSIYFVLGIHFMKYCMSVTQHVGDITNLFSGFKFPTFTSHVFVCD